MDAIAPDLILGAHIVGSAVLGDYVPGASDLDLICELARPPDAQMLAATLPADVDVIFVRSGELALPVREARTIAWGRDGVLHTESQGDLVPVLWEQLRAHAETLRGPTPSPPVTAEEVARYCLANLQSYWRPLLEQVAPSLAVGVHEPVGAELLPATVWLASGPPRLWHTIRTGQIISKSEALRRAAGHWVDLAEPLGEIGRCRRDASRGLTGQHARAAVVPTERILAENQSPR